jgi:hypothetical protein
MEIFNLNNSEQENIGVLISDACVTFAENLKPQFVVVDGSFDESKNLLSFQLRIMDNEWVHISHLRLIFDMLSYLPVKKQGKHYCFESVYLYRSFF